jgi:hypothetical protein
VNGPTTGFGTLRMNGGAVVVSSRVGVEAASLDERRTHMVKIAMKETFLGGCELDVKLSAEDAAQFASVLYALAKEAMLKNEQEAAERAAA